MSDALKLVGGPQLMFPQERSLAELFRELAQQARTLVRQEVALVTATTREWTDALLADAIWIGAGVLLLHVALGTAAAAAVLALAAAGLPLPAAAGLLAVTLGAVAAFIVRSRVSAIRRRGSLARTLHEGKEIGQWLRDQTREPNPSGFGATSSARER